MRINTFATVVLFFAGALIFAGCPGQEKGTLELNLDFTELLTVKGDIQITRAAVELSRSGFSTITRDLTIASNVATGRVDGLDGGYWKLKLDVYSGASRIFTGSQDVLIIPGVVVEATILVEPVVEEPEDGSVSITVRVNPMPGYKVIDQVTDAIFLSPTDDEIYIYDAAARNIGIYNASILARIDDLALPQAPLSIELARDGASFIVGYSTGQVYSLKIADESFTLIGDALMEVKKVLSLSAKYILLVGPGRDDQIKVMDVTTGQITDSASDHYTYGQVIYNPASGNAYATDTGVSPSDLHRIRLDLATGTIVDVQGSIYHGDYSFGTPISLIDNGTRLTTSSGNMFTTSQVPANDLVYAGNIGIAYADLTADDVNNSLYVLNRNPSFGSPIPRKLLIMDGDSYFVEKTLDLSGDPYRVFETATHIIVFSKFEGRPYGKVFEKASLGL